MILGSMVGLGNGSPKQSLLGDAPSVGGYPSVKLMQKALHDLAVKVQNTGCDPSRYDGVVTLGTILALANTAHVLGQMVNSVVGAALDLIELIKAPFKAVPYGDSVINVILSPWIVDNVYDILLAIVGLFPGGSGVASSIRGAVDAFKATLATAAAPLATAITIATTQVAAQQPPGLPPPPDLHGTGLGVVNPATMFAIQATPINANSFVSTPKPTTQNPPPGFTWVVDHWERARVGQTPIPGPNGGTGPTVREHPTMATGPTMVTPLTPKYSVQDFMAGVHGAVIRDHRAWEVGRRISNDYGGSSWDERVMYSAVVPFENLSRTDQNYWNNWKWSGHTEIVKGKAAFVRFYGKSGQRMGAFWDEATQTLKIQRVAKLPSKKGHWYDFINNIVPDFLDDFIEASWAWIKENTEDVFEAIQHYGCLIVNNDIIVATVAAGAGILATPATSATVVAAAAAGHAACAALVIGEAIYAIIKFLALSHDPPPPLTLGPKDLITQMQVSGGVGLSVVLPPTNPVPDVKPENSVFPTPPGMGMLSENFKRVGYVIAGLAVGAAIWKLRKS